MQPLVTIVTITCNLIKEGRKDCFRQCVDSVRMQDYPNIEHIIVDGASTDGSIELFKELGVNYISEPDTGIYNAFNKGIKRAKGEYIAFLNSDDFFAVPEAISRFVAAIKTSDADFTSSSVNLINTDNSIKVSPARWNFCFFGTPFCHQTMISKTKMLRDLGGFNEKYRVYADFDLILRAIFSGYKPVVLSESLVSFRLGGMSSEKSKKINQEQIEVIEKNCNVSHQTAFLAAKYCFMPRKTLLSLIAKTVDFPDKNGILKNSRNRFFKYVKKQLFTLNFRKGKRCFRLLGITFYDEDKFWQQ